MRASNKYLKINHDFKQKRTRKIVFEKANNKNINTNQIILRLQILKTISQKKFCSTEFYYNICVKTKIKHLKTPCKNL